MTVELTVHHIADAPEFGSPLNLSASAEEAAMTTILVAMRAAIIWWVSVSLMPIEVVYDAIESELERRDVPS
jgi:hypothetical protein